MRTEVIPILNKTAMKLMPSAINKHRTATYGIAALFGFVFVQHLNLRSFQQPRGIKQFHPKRSFSYLLRFARRIHTRDVIKRMPSDMLR